MTLRDIISERTADSAYGYALRIFSRARKLGGPVAGPTAGAPAMHRRRSLVDLLGTAARTTLAVLALVALIPTGSASAAEITYTSLTGILA